tara:strand:- start:4006 stop:4869 length:864 start_codon:yes stop_codon:yes gene_type:complete
MKSLILGRARDVIGALLLASLMGACAHRSVSTTKGALSFGVDVTKIRIEMSNGTLDLAAVEAGASQSEITWQGGIRRDAGSAEDLTKIEVVSTELAGSMDPGEPGTFVVTCPKAPSGVVGMIAYEGNLRVPAKLPLEVVVTDNGHVTMAGREAFSKVTTRRGDLRFQACKGGVEANTGQGNVIAFDHEGDLDVRTGLGDMQVFIVKPGKQITLWTGQGTVQCHVPADIEFQVDARAEIGRIGNDFDIEVRKVGEYSAAMAGIHISPKTVVLLRTASGHISLIRRKPE